MTNFRKFWEGINASSRVGPYDTYQAFKASQRAEELMERFRQQRINQARSIGDVTERSRQLRILRGPAHNNELDAFRHCAWNIEMTRSLGVDQAKEIADLHERVNINAPSEHHMDYHNNHIGRTIAQDPSLSHLNTYDATLQALNRGRLMVEPDFRPGGADGDPNTPW